MVLRIAVLALLSTLVCSPAARAQEPRESSRFLGWDSGAVDETTTLARLRTAAQRYREQAPVARYALLDIAYPTDTLAYRQQRGFGLILLTAVVQDSADLPLRHLVYQPATGASTDLARLAMVCGRLGNTATDVAKVFGPYRCDALYLFPLAFRASVGELLVDFNASDQRMQLMQLNGLLPPHLRGVPLLPANTPADTAAMLRFAQRAFPGILRGK